MKTFSIQPGPVRPSVSSGTSDGAGGDHQHVVGEDRAVGQVHGVVGDVDAVDAALAERDAVVQLAVPRPHDLVGVGQPEGDEQQPRLVDVAVVLIDHGDLDIVTRTRAASGSPSASRRCRHRGPRSVATTTPQDSSGADVARAEGPRHDRPDRSSAE